MENLLNLPIYKAVISDNDEGMYTISLVDEPAVESNFQCFSKDKQHILFNIDNEEQRIVTGVIMRCNFPIYRRSNEGFEYYIIYDKDTLEVMAEKWLADGLHNNVNLEHNPNNYVNDVYLKEVYFKDVERGVNPKGFEDIENGSLFGTYKILNDDVWNKVKNGTFKGFSLEGWFDLKECDVKEVQDDEYSNLVEIISMLKECNKRGIK